MRTKLLVSAVASGALLLTAPLSATAESRASAPTVTVVNSEVAAPFSLAVRYGKVYVADGGTGLVSRLVKGKLKTIATGPTAPGDVAGLALSRNGRYLAYTATVDDTHTKTSLEIRGPFGHRVSADLAGYEARVNPDKIRVYGVEHPSECVREAFKHIKDAPPVRYTGAKDSHPYAVASYRKKWIVADAGGNDLLWVDRKGNISTAAVLPRQPLFISKSIAKSLDLPACVVGVTYNFEPVPTDVEVGHDGYLYVSTLVGGPEDPSLGARSRVYRVDPKSGHSIKVGDKLLGATNLAVDRKGRIYVAELFGGRISVLKHGRPRTYAELPNALSVEIGAKGSLWAGTLGGQGPGTIVHITR